MVVGDSGNQDVIERVIASNQTRRNKKKSCFAIIVTPCRVAATYNQKSTRVASGDGDPGVVRMCVRDCV